jgi:hypothetical protein
MYLVARPTCAMAKCTNTNEAPASSECFTPLSTVHGNITQSYLGYNHVNHSRCGYARGYVHGKTGEIKRECDRKGIEKILMAALPMLRMLAALIFQCVGKQLRWTQNRSVCSLKLASVGKRKTLFINHRAVIFYWSVDQLRQFLFERMRLSF